MAVHSKNLILREIEERIKTLDESPSNDLNVVKSEDERRRRAYYKEAETEVMNAVQEILRHISTEQQRLDHEYRSLPMRELRAYCFAYARTFYELTNNRNHELYKYMNGTSQRKKDSREITNKSMQVVNYLDDVKVGHKRYQKGEVEMRLSKLTTALRNLVPHVV